MLGAVDGVGMGWIVAWGTGVGNGGSGEGRSRIITKYFSPPQFVLLLKDLVSNADTAPMNFEERIKLEIRLTAIEHFLVEAYSLLLLAASKTPSKDLALFVAQQEQTVLPGLDPAFSDHASAEWQSAVERIASLISPRLTKVGGKGSLGWVLREQLVHQGIQLALGGRRKPRGLGWLVLLWLDQDF